MNTIIEVPWKERVQIESDYYDVGWQEGLQWANHARYEDLQYAVNSYVITNNVPHVISVGYDPREDKVLGDYFSNYFDSCADFQIEITKSEDSGCSRAMPTEAFCLWEQGWYDAVTEFWQTIQTYDHQEM
jgi:hypothetical protein